MRGAIIVVAALALYVWLCPDYIVSGDNAEFATLGVKGGVAHPSGYPSYVLWLRLWSWLPGATPAHVTALATALCAAIQLYVLHAACRAWGASAAAATAAIAIYAAAPVVLRLHSEAEVFAFNGLVVALILWLAAAGGPVRGLSRAVLLGLVAGIGLANHMTCGLLAPVGILGIVRAVRERGQGGRSASLVTAAALGAFVIGLTPYLYLLVAPRNDMSWGNIDGFPALVRHVLRMDYGGPSSLSAHTVVVPATASIAALARTLLRGWLVLPLLLGLGTLGALAIRKHGAGDGAEPRVGWAMLAISWVLAGPVLVSRFNLQPHGATAYVVERFHVLPSLLLAIPVAVGFERVARWLAPHVRSQLARSLPAITIIAVAGLAAIAAPSLAHVSAIHSPAIQAAVENLLGSMPPNAVVITVSDELMFGLGYAQVALGERPDVTAITWSMMPMVWYRNRIGAHGLPLPVARSDAASIELARIAFAANRPLFIDQFEGKIAGAFPTYPYGLLFRALPVDSKAPSLDEVVELNRAAYAKFDLSHKPGPDDGFATAVFDRYALTWDLLAKALARNGKPAEAADAQQNAFALSPRDPEELAAP